MKRSPLAALLLATSLLAAACGSSETTGSTEPADTAVADTASGGEDVATDDTASGADTATGSDTASGTDTGVDPFGAFPAGPYGNKVGDIVANLQWEGYVSPLSDALANTKPYVTTSMDKLRRDAKKGYALVHVSEFY